VFLQSVLLLFNLLQLLTWEGLYAYKSPLLTYPLTPSTLLPFDLSTLCLFFTFHLAVTDYIGRSEWDRAQYMAIRVLPFFTCLLDMMINVQTKTHVYRYFVLALWLCKLVHFIFFDWARAFETPF